MRRARSDGARSSFGHAVAAQRFSVDDLGLVATHWDAAVDRTPGADGFCASTLWSFSAATSFPDVGEPVLIGDGEAFCGMRGASSEDGRRVLVGLDPVWGFATPLVGPPIAAARMLGGRLSLEDFDLAVVAGQREDGALTAAVVRQLDGGFRLFRGSTEHRLRIDLQDGVDAWFARRSGRFRQRLRRLRRDAREREVAFVDLSAMPPDEVLDRLVAIEADTWKGQEGTGLTSTDLASFYRQVCARLAAAEQLRVVVARLDGHDAGYVLGGVRGRIYRGLQLSYTQAAAGLGLGHILQIEQLERLEQEGIDVYDLGMDMPYKRRWADRVDDTISVIVSR
jgi:CelD/BcsL family acetyltransferase involved in cellulose biosynthesis